MDYTLPQLEGLAETLNKINDYDSDGRPNLSKDDEALSGRDAVEGLRQMGLI